MSYRWGTNGHDLDWDAVMGLYDYCLQCEEIRWELKQKIKQLLDEYFGNVDDLVDDFVDELMSMYECTGHEHVYSPVELNFEKMIEEGLTIDDVAPWYIWHDTNSNFVCLVGDVPDQYLTEEYIRERDEYLKANGLL